MIIYQFITPAFHISFSYSWSRAALVHSGSCGYRGGGFSAREAGQGVLVACLCRFVKMNNNYFCWKRVRSHFLELQGKCRFFFDPARCENTWQLPRILCGDTVRFKTCCFWHTFESDFGICHIATCSVPLTVDIFKLFVPIKLLRNFPWAFLFFQYSGNDVSTQKVLGKFSFEVVSCYWKRPSCTFLAFLQLQTSRREAWCQVWPSRPIFRTL